MGKKIPVVTYYLNGQEVMRSLPTSVAQTANTIAASGKFGNLSRLASAIAACLTPLQPCKIPRQPYNHFLRGLVKWIHGLKNNPHLSPADYLGSIRFVPQRGIENVLLFRPVVLYNDPVGVKVQLPSFIPKEAIQAPPGCKEMELMMMAVSCRPFTKEITTVDSNSVTIPFNDTRLNAAEIMLRADQSTGTLTLVAMAVKYDGVTWLQDAPVSRRKWMPAGIVSCNWVGF